VFGSRRFLRCEDGVKGAAELAVAVVDQQPILARAEDQCFERIDLPAAQSPRPQAKNAQLFARGPRSTVNTSISTGRSPSDEPLDGPFVAELETQAADRVAVATI
jgi:hypothetical protein